MPGSLFALNGAPLVIAAERTVLLSSEPPGATLDGQFLSRVIHVEARGRLELRHIHLMSGRAFQAISQKHGGGGIRTGDEAVLTLTNVRITDCAAISGNEPNFGGAILLSRNSTSIFRQVAFVRCFSSADYFTGGSAGAVMLQWSSVDMIGVSFISCFSIGLDGAGRGQGVVTFGGGEYRLTDVSWSNCSAGQQGGGCQIQQGAEVSMIGVSFSGCNAGSYGGAVAMTSGNDAGLFRVTIRDSIFSDCHANAVSAQGGACFVDTTGELRLSSTVVRRCSAKLGGGVSSVGLVIFMNGTRFIDCSASGGGNSLHISSGVATYVLPAPPAYWVPAQLCEVYRESCAAAGAGPDCLARESTCKQIAMQNVPGCQPVTINQPCDWVSLPWLIGLLVQTLPHGEVDDDFPMPCAAGLQGSKEPGFQASASCAGPCQVSVQPVRAL